VKFKLDENLSPTLASGFLATGHEAHSVLEQALGGASDQRVIEVCRLENRALITLDLDFANIQRYPPPHYAGIIVLRLGARPTERSLPLWPTPCAYSSVKCSAVDCGSLRPRAFVSMTDVPQREAAETRQTLLPVSSAINAFTTSFQSASGRPA
jgi:predicted nuclease of predicted toxin-antitoxin system